ncbi:MAG: hypothetical protein A3K19_12005 [Lentisphaerae bacterium RIFOXYB12_FULL_65_16]|nr:MAG: hypothetical protein A3K18_17480 [Lentisphaerae bacterium RIFOXYA12_64_32]OGV95150.1 MAG: hypothetical protein A3K19_12005 [Lentisphaerae bacterium RIFOXYB12_FULL_65_16]
MKPLLTSLFVMLLLTRTSVLCAADQPAPNAVPEPVSEQVRYDLALLAERGLVTAPDAWAERLVASPTCDGEQAAALLVQAVQAFKPVKDVREAIDVLAQRGVIGSPEYWVKGTATGSTCSSANLAIVLNRIASRLPIRQTRPFTAAPLAAIPAAQIKPRYDVVIAGAGTGGCGTAIQAARMGCSVLLLEETDWIGGQMNAAAVTSMDEGGTLCRERGIYRELCGLIVAHYQPLNMTCETAYWFRHVCVEPRVGRQLLHLMLGDARGDGTLDLALRARVTKVLKNGDTVTGAEIECISDAGRETRTVQSHILVDATECGDVIPLTGARYRVGNCLSTAVNPAQRVQDNTWCAVVKQYPNGVPPALLITQPPPGYTDAVHKAFLKSLIAGDTVTSSTNRPWNFATFIGYRGMPDSSRSGDAPPITRTHMNYNNDFPNDVGDLEAPAKRLQTLRAMRLKTLHLLYYIQNTLGKKDWSVADDEGYDTPYNRAEIDAWITSQPDLAPYRPILYHFPVMAYTRESRRIVGLHTLNVREIERYPGRPVRFASCVALGDYPVDLHGSKKPAYLELDLDPVESIPDEKFGSRGTGPFPIPFECFIPETLDGFLPAEKNISQSRLANGATRLQPHTLLMGQAVGAIVALAVQHQVQPRQLDPVLVQLALLDAGDTLFLTPVADIRQNHPDRKVVQLVLTHNLLAIDGGSFGPGKPLADDELAGALKLLADGKTPPPNVTLPVTRIEAARTFADFLEKRARANLDRAHNP